MRFHDLFLLASTAALVFAAPSEKKKRVSNFQFFGVNESGAEFGMGNIPGVKGTDYTWPVTSTIDTLVGNGFNIFRIAILMERIIPNSLTGSTNAAYLQDLTTLVNYITSKGAYAVIDPHNFGRYYGNVITDTSGFQTFWKTLATPFASNSRVVFDCNNEPHDMPSISLVQQLNQGCINGVRSAGATSQYIFVEGTSYSGAWTWYIIPVSSSLSFPRFYSVTNIPGSPPGNTALASLTDPQNKIVYEMHQYLDSDGSGTSATCVSGTIGAERLAAATAWLKSSGKKGILGEFAGGANSNCQTAVKGMLQYMINNKDVWLGAMWWGGGPWWGDYIFSFEPPSGTGYTNYLSILQTYM